MRDIINSSSVAYVQGARLMPYCSISSPVTRKRPLRGDSQHRHADHMLSTARVTSSYGTAQRDGGLRIAVPIVLPCQGREEADRRYSRHQGTACQTLTSCPACVVLPQKDQAVHMFSLITREHIILIATCLGPGSVYNSS